MPEIQSPSSPIGKRYWIIVIIVVAFLTGVFGYILGASTKSTTNLITQTIPKPTLLPGYLNSSIIRSQQAIAVGKITQVMGDQIIVEGDDKTSISLKLSPHVVIYVPSATTSAVNKPSSNLSDIKLNQKALINLSFENGILSVTSISYPTVK